jgi:hypothetical protein
MVKRQVLTLVFFGVLFPLFSVFADTIPVRQVGSLPVVIQPVAVAPPPPVIPLPRVIGITTVQTIPAQKTTAKEELRDFSPDLLLRPQVAYPGNIIRFTISNPDEFLKIRPRDRSKVVIYINGVELKGMSANWYSSVTNQQISAGNMPAFKKDEAQIDIVLRRNDSTQTAWNFFYNNTPRFFANYVDVDASIGWEGMSSLEKDITKAANIRIIYYKVSEFIIWLSFFVILLIAFAFLAFKTNAIREGDFSGAYSLSLTQLLFWTTLAIGAFIYTLVLTDITSSFNSSILYMLGISLTTTGVAGAIDTQFKTTNLKDIKKPHNNFFQDVLTSDGTSYSVQRIQIFAWNLVLGLYFIVYTIKNKSMPVFSEVLLVLAGFSSLSYLGAKSPENAMIKKDKEAEVIVGTVTTAIPGDSLAGGPSTAETDTLVSRPTATDNAGAPEKNATNPSDNNDPIAVG